MYYTHQALSGACRAIARLHPGLPPITAKGLRSMSPADFYSTQRLFVRAIWDSAGDPKERNLLATKWLPIAATYAANFRASGNEDWRTRDEFCEGFLYIANYLIRYECSTTARESALAYFNLNEMLGAVEPIKSFVSDVWKNCLYRSEYQGDIETDAFIVSSFAYHANERVQKMLTGITQYGFLFKTAKFCKQIDSAQDDNFFKNLLQTVLALGFSKFIGHSLQSFLQIIRERESTLPDERALGVILRAKYDHKTYALDDLDHAENMQDSGLRTFYYEVNSNEAARLAIHDAARLQEISFLILNAHGNFGRITWSKNIKTDAMELMFAQDVESIFGDVKNRFIDGAVIIIASCLAAGVDAANPVSLVEAVSRTIPQAFVLGMETNVRTTDLLGLFSVESDKVVTNLGSATSGLRVAPTCYRNGKNDELPPRTRYWLLRN